MFTLIAVAVISCSDANAIIRRIYNNNYLNDNEKKELVDTVLSATSPECSIPQKTK
jgi:hypothetical protein